MTRERVVGLGVDEMNDDDLTRGDGSTTQAYLPRGSGGQEMGLHPRASICTYTGREFFPFKPEAKDIVVEDIAHALSRKCRYTGHTRKFESVAEHSVAVSRLLQFQGADERTAKWGLLHDASEAYLPDIASPLKKSLWVHVYVPDDEAEGAPDLISFAEAENRILQVIAEKFDLPWPMPVEVKNADCEIFKVERRMMMEYDKSQAWWLVVPPTSEAVRSVYHIGKAELWPDEAKAVWLHRYKVLTE